MAVVLDSFFGQYAGARLTHHHGFHRGQKLVVFSFAGRFGGFPRRGAAGMSRPIDGEGRPQPPSYPSQPSRYSPIYASV